MHKYNLKRQVKDKRDSIFYNLAAAPIKLPKSVDLRPNCPVIYDQLAVGSCTANSGCAYLSMLLAKPTLMFSRLFQYYNERVIEGDTDSDAGAQMRDIGAAMVANGVCLEFDWSYDLTKLCTKPSDQCYILAKPYAIKMYSALNSLQEIKMYMALHSLPVLIGLDVYKSFESEIVTKTGKVPMPKGDEELLGGHAVLVVGYQDGMFTGGNLIIRNSWGPEWGDHGYFYLPYEYVNQGLAYDFWTLS